MAVLHRFYCTLFPIKNRNLDDFQCPDCVFILMGITDKPGLENISGRYHVMIKQNFLNMAEELDEELSFSTE